MTSRPDEGTPVEVARAPNEIMAGMWQSWLEDEGIVVLVKPSGPGSAYFSNFGNEHVLYVRAEDVERAREILEETAILDDELEDGEDE